MAQLFSLQMLPASLEARDQPGAPSGYAEEEGRCHSPSLKCLQVELRAQEGALHRESEGPCVHSPPWDPDPVQVK